MGLYWNIKSEDLSDEALLDQHRSCHAHFSIFENRGLVTNNFTLTDLANLHFSTVREMLSRGIQHHKPLNEDSWDFETASQVLSPIILTSPSHPQMAENARCPICCRVASIRFSKIPGVYECSHCGQRFSPFADIIAGLTAISQGT